jgi:translation elongation factor EF-G
MTQGRGFFRKTFSHYEAVPAEVTRKIVEAMQAAEAQA